MLAVKTKAEAIPEHEKSCEDRIDDRLASTLEDLEDLMQREDIGTAINEYFLGFDYVEPETFNEQKEGFFRLQMSWGGPSDEFRIFTNPDYSIHRVEYHFQDWGDGALRECRESNSFTGNEQIVFDLIDQNFQFDFEHLATKGD